MKKRIVHLISTDVFSGAENVACQIINNFDKNNYEMIYVAKIGNNFKSLKDRNIKYYELKKFDYFNIKKALKDLRPNIIHAHDIRASIYASLFYRKYKIIAHIHANHENMRKLCLKTFLFNIFSKKMDNVIWVSNSALDNYHFRKNIIDKSIVLYNVINTNEIVEKIKLDKKEYPNYDAIYLGRMTYQKNPIRLLEIIKKVLVDMPNFHIAFVGNGELEEEVKKYINDNEMEKNVIYYGFVANPYKILQSSKIMIMTSRYEGTPMVVLEALSLGKPIISTPTDGIKDIIEQNKNGFISNNDDEISRRIVNLLNKPSILNNMKKEAKKSSDKINNLSRYMEKLNSLYSR